MRHATGHTGLGRRGWRALSVCGQGLPIGAYIIWVRIPLDMPFAWQSTIAYTKFILAACNCGQNSRYLVST